MTETPEQLRMHSLFRKQDWEEEIGPEPPEHVHIDSEKQKNILTREFVWNHSNEVFLTEPPEQLCMHSLLRTQDCDE